MNPIPQASSKSGGNSRGARGLSWRTGLLWLLFIVAGLVAGRWAIRDSARQQAHKEIEEELDRASQRVKDALEVERDALAVAAHNAASNPRLMAAVSGRVDKATWDDLLANEPWWERYREDLVMGVSHAGTTLTYEQTPVVAALPWGPLIEKAREGRTSTTALLVGRARATAALGVAISMEAFGGHHGAVLVFARPLDEMQLAKLSAKTRTPLVLSDGKQVLARAGFPDGTPNSVWSEVTAPGAQSRGVHKAGLSLRAATLADGLWLWTGTPVEAIKARVLAGASRSWRMLLAAGALLAVAGFGLLAWRGRRAPVAPASAAAAQAAPQSSWRPTAAGAGSRLGRYLLVDRIGEGGMAEIFTAVSFGTGGFQRNFVVKRLRQEMTHNPTVMAHFFDEANLASQLVHPNIAQVFDFGQSNGNHYLAQEHVPGRDLGRITRALIDQRQPPLPQAALLYAAHEILSALEYAHDRRDVDEEPLGIVHRDVTPENIMISERGDVKLLDFGIVKAHRRRASQTEVGQLKGNLDYMSPEQARGQDVDRRSDLFSLGVTLYFCATHESLYDGDSAYERLMKAATGPGEVERAKIAALPAPMNAILAKALAASADDRFATAADFKAAVAPHVAGGREAIRLVLLRLFENDILLERDRLAATRPPRDLPADDGDEVDADVGMART